MKLYQTVLTVLIVFVTFISCEFFAEDYTSLQGYNKDADLGLGCGIPTEFAQINEGDTVLDLGSGAGNDCFVARTLVGEKGKIIGLDMTETMINDLFVILGETFGDGFIQGFNLGVNDTEKPKDHFEWWRPDRGF